MKKITEFVTEYEKYNKEFQNMLKQHADEKEQSQLWFEKQVGAIQGIKGSTGYKEIKNYLTRDMITNQELIMKASKLSQDEFSKHAYGAAIELGVYYKLLSFLDSLENYETIERAA